jgi:hypothetical protein
MVRGHENAGLAQKTGTRILIAGECVYVATRPSQTLQNLRVEVPGMARVGYESKSMARSPRLTPEELASLQEVASRPMQRTIPDDHRDRLLKAGYIREVVSTHGGVSALALTGLGLKRLATLNK